MPPPRSPAHAAASWQPSRSRRSPRRETAERQRRTETFSRSSTRTAPFTRKRLTSSRRRCRRRARLPARPVRGSTASLREFSSRRSLARRYAGWRTLTSAWCSAAARISKRSAVTTKSLLCAEDVEILIELKKLGRSRKQKFVRAKGARALTSARKFDTLGDWHYFRMAPPTAIFSMLFNRRALQQQMGAEKIREYWYDVRSSASSQER
jgi:hypothetical protein